MRELPLAQPTFVGRNKGTARRSACDPPIVFKVKHEQFTMNRDNLLHTQCSSTNRLLKLLFVAAISACLLFLAACTSSPGQTSGCGTKDRTLTMGFFANFDPVSYSKNHDPASPDFNVHEGFEADLVTALEKMEGPRLSFNRQGLSLWEDIWLQPASDQYDLAGGGITILDSRTRDADGRKAVAFTSGHISFRQSLQVRSQDAAKINSYADLNSTMKVGVSAGTTGEHRLLELLGLVDEKGVLAEGIRVDTPRGTVVTDGSAEYFITAARASPILEGRSLLHPSAPDLPQVVYLGDEMDDRERLQVLSEGRVNAIARGEIEGRRAAHTSAGAFAVTALDDRVETGGFSVAAGDTELLACLNERIQWLTDDRKIDFADWLADPKVFDKRALAWNTR
jgi:ABC-type amino acid transport substrate-binding protein